MQHEVFIFFFAAAQEAQQTSHFISAHGTGRQVTFLSIRFLYLYFWNVGADEKPGIFLLGLRHFFFFTILTFPFYVSVLAINDGSCFNPHCPDCCQTSATISWFVPSPYLTLFLRSSTFVLFILQLSTVHATLCPEN